MLGKLLKHEFRATGRILLPIYGAVIALAALANVSIRLLDRELSPILRFLFVLVLVCFVLGMILAGVMTAWMMIKRFYTNLLKDEGYLMHTLPVSVHALVWSKMIAALCWFVMTFLVVWLSIGLTVLIQNNTNLGELLAELPSWHEIRQVLREMGIRGGDITLLLGETAMAILLGGVMTCLHFYAAMSLGHMFSENKLLLSVVFFVLISIMFSFFTTGYGFYIHWDSLDSAETVAGGIRVVQGFIGKALLMEGIQAAVLYLATVLGLKKGLNLA